MSNSFRSGVRVKKLPFSKDDLYRMLDTRLNPNKPLPRPTLKELLKRRNG